MPSLPEVKGRVFQVIREFRSLDALGASEITISKLDSGGGKSHIRGFYDCKNILGDSIEKGNFDIWLLESDLSVSNASITPTGGFRKRP
jgi:hypothetical protein